MKKILLLTLLASSAVAVPSIIPQPNQIQPLEGKGFVFSPEMRIMADPELAALAKQLNAYLAPAFGFSLPVVDDAGSGDPVFLRLDSSLDLLGEEGYSLKVESGEIVISACKPVGIFYGIQTLRQLLPPAVFSKETVRNVDWCVPAVSIEDSPRFGFRSLQLDCAARFLPVEFIKKTIDLMAMHKLNRLHWQLADGRIWRLEIQKYSELASLESYTHEQVREVVDYARERFVEIVPEIGIPSCSVATLEAYPSLKNASEKELVAFNQSVLKEVLGLFSGERIYIGRGKIAQGSEKADQEKLRRRLTEALADTLKKAGRKAVGRVDQIMGCDLPPGSEAMCWAGGKYLESAIEQGLDVVLTPGRYFNFDYYQDVPAREPLATSASFLPLEKVYAYNPDLSLFERQEQLFGVQGNVRTRLMQGEAAIERMAWPRACALAEVAWTLPERKDYGDFKERLAVGFQRLDALGVNYFKERDTRKPEGVVRVMTYNVLYGGEAGRDYIWYDKKKSMGFQIDSGERFDRLAKVIRDADPDIVFLEECTEWANNDAAIFKKFAAKLGMHGAILPDRNQFKVAILSRFPLENIRCLDDDAPFAHNILYADVVLPDGMAVTLASLHFGWWGDPKWRTYDTEGQKACYARQFDYFLKELATRRGKPFIFGGDFNHAFNDANFEQEALYAGVVAQGYTDACFSIYKDYSRVISGTQKNVLKDGPIDFIFVSPELADSILNADIIYSLDTFETSDHLPVWVDIALREK